MREGVEEDDDEEEGRRLDGKEKAGRDQIYGCTPNQPQNGGLCWCRIKVPYTIIPLYCSCRWQAV